MLSVHLPLPLPLCPRFVVDFFGPGCKRVGNSSNGYWVLTHFHADHYKGLTKAFSLGTVLCSPVTAALVSAKLKVGG